MYTKLWYRWARRCKMCSENELPPPPTPPQKNLLKPNNSTDQTQWCVLQHFTDYINSPYCSIDLNADGAKALPYWSQAFISRGNAVIWTWHTWVERWKEAREVWQQKSPHIGRWPQTSTAESFWSASVGQVMTVCRASRVSAHKQKYWKLNWVNTTSTTKITNITNNTHTLSNRKLSVMPVYFNCKYTTTKQTN